MGQDNSMKKLDRNGIPILDTPKETNRLTPTCKPDAHLWVTVKSETEIHGHEELVRECSRCGRVSSFKTMDDRPYTPSFPTARQAPKFHVLSSQNDEPDYEEQLRKELFDGVRIHQGNLEPGRIRSAVSADKRKVLFVLDLEPEPDARRAIDILRDGFVSGEMSRKRELNGKRCPLCSNRPCRCGAFRK